ncbi:MAG: hypothetical protein WBE76_24770 [Terracidiphilus sp.]
MNLSISEFGKNIGAWMFWGLVFWLVLELGPFLITGWVFKKTAGELAIPYLAFAVPWAIMAPLIWWLRKWEERGVSPRRVARGWGLSMVLFGFAVGFAVFYLGINLHLIAPRDAVIGFVVTVLLSAPIFYFGMYHMALARISSRTSGKLSGPHLN